MAQIVFKNLGTKNRKALEAGIKRTRLVPTDEGSEQLTAICETFNYGLVERNVQPQPGVV